MDFPLASAQASDIRWVARTGSTNTDLVTEAASLPDFSVLITDEQVSGRGRSGRSWEAPAGSSMMASVLLRPSSVAPTQFSWLPLIAGLSLANAVSSFGGTKRAMVKWPNDVLIGDLKVAGVLSEALSDLSGVVIGTGLNVFQSREQLPVETASSLSQEGIAVPSIDAVFAEYLKHLRRNYEDFISCHGELAGTELLQAIKNSCSTIGRAVRVFLPGEKELLGEAIDIDDLGRIVVAHDGKHTAVSVGDIVHLRHN
jgi:BirA family biotin operon repressor/biotin-[acetyl-CoA-carboxylase] ligase